MKRLLVAAAILACSLTVCFAQAAAGPAQPAESTLPEYAPGRVLVRMDPNKVYTMSERDLGIRYQDTVGSEGAIKYEISDGSTVEQKIAQLKNMPGVLAAEPDVRVFLQQQAVVPDDAHYNKQWHLEQISASKAWGISQGSSQVRVCVVDSGAKKDHPDLAGSIHKGFNLVPKDESNPNNPPPARTDPHFLNYDDTHGHGTHVAGTIAAVTNNRIGVAGAAWNVKLVICRFIWRDGSGYISDAINCLKLCREEGAMISSNSWGGIGYSDFLASEIQAANDAGQLFVVAAGNNGQDMDDVPLYPSALKINNVLSVASSGTEDAISGFSNFGKSTIHISAPGEAVLSTTKDGKYGLMYGTSMACPLVTAAAALAQSTALAGGRTLTHTQLKAYIMGGVDKTSGAKQKVITGGRLNLFNTVKAVAKDFPSYPSPPPPSPPPPSPPPPSPPPPGSPPPPPSPPPPSPPPPPPSPPPPAPPPPAATVTCGSSISQGLKAYQSSTANGRPASLAVDGNCNTLPGGGSCAQTDPDDPSPYWWVDLGRTVNVRSILVTTRTDYGWTALGLTKVLLGNQTWTDAGSEAMYTLCGTVQGSFGPNNARQPVYCDDGRGVLARYVALYRPQRRGQLTLCEVDVVGDEMRSTAGSMSFSAQALQEGGKEQGGELLGAQAVEERESVEEGATEFSGLLGQAGPPRPSRKLQAVQQWQQKQGWQGRTR